MQRAGTWAGQGFLYKVLLGRAETKIRPDPTPPRTAQAQSIEPGLVLTPPRRDLTRPLSKVPLWVATDLGALRKGEAETYAAEVPVWGTESPSNGHYEQCQVCLVCSNGPDPTLCPASRAGALKLQLQALIWVASPRLILEALTSPLDANPAFIQHPPPLGLPAP